MDIDEDDYKTVDLMVENSFGLSIIEMTVRHRAGNRVNHQTISTFYDIPPNTTSSGMTTHIFSGLADYWWVTFSTLNADYAISSKFKAVFRTPDWVNAQAIIRVHGDSMKLEVWACAAGKEVNCGEIALQKR